ncbi:DUF1579 family protein [Algoriphagus sp. Y33]|uniref:DUF1579 family protein n=1 Tax=Algoriphagus sp. Y33 TaxID=2772483 RepID=UPI00178538BF|nr:DUF1579 family protein [Algoriphagus sp. Y33]
MKKLIISLLIISCPLVMKAQNQNAWVTYMTPSEVHTMLSNYEGEFKLEIRMTGQEESTIVNATNKMILGGRFLQIDQQGQMIGMKYEALSTIGYNTIDGTISLATITNMGTGTLSVKGEWVQADKVASMKGTLTNPVTKNVINVTQKIAFIDKNSFVIESFDQEGNQPEKKTVEYIFKRK